MAVIKCAFCKGKGTDPFDLLSKFATCQVCRGIGKLELKKPIIKCAFCKGSGIHPHSRITCAACRGKGSVTYNGKTECPACKGSGYRTDGNLPCGVCDGRGVMRKRRL